MSKRRVVVTGLGIISPVGSTVPAAWEAVVNGKSGIGPITRMDVTAFPVRFGGAVQGFDVNQYISVKDARRMDEFMQYGVAAGMQAVVDSGTDFDNCLLYTSYRARRSTRRRRGPHSRRS